MIPVSQNTVVKDNAGHIDMWPTCFSSLPFKEFTHKKNKPVLLQNLEMLLKNELDKLIGYKIESPSKIRLQRTVAIFNEECEQKIMKLKQEEKKDLIILQEENESLKKKILFLKQEIDSLNFQVKKCQEDIAIQYEKYREESDARKLLIQDLNDLIERKNSRSFSFDGVNADDEQVNDPVVLRIALSRVREDFNKNTQKLAEVLASYGDVVPRRDFEKLEVQYKELEVAFDLLKKDYASLLSENKVLIAVHEKDTDLHFQYDTLHEKATPRPSLDKYVLYLEGKLDDWSEQTKGKSTRDKVEMLFSSVTGQNLSDSEKIGYKMFQPKGDSDEIPRYLRSTQPVRNRFLCKRDLCIIIDDVWSQKCLEEGCSPLLKRSHMSQFLYDYLKKMFQLELMVTEWGYNIHESCLRFSYDKKVKFFFDVLKSEADEDIYYVQFMQLEKLFNSLVSFDPTKTDYIEKNDFCNCLQKFFPKCATEDIDALINCAEKDLKISKNDKLLYKSLFKKDEEGNYGLFINCVMKFLQRSSKLVIDKLMAHLESKTYISPMDLQEAMQSIDSNISDETAQHVISFVYCANIYNQQLQKLTKNELLTKLVNSSI
ncbi:translin-associated factor X-interacting protein 1-like isoform X2 [Hydra vulgaris]|uniref:Translin-associated factor X-interacting protein 1-like isoform X2 n=1 Tax=Hydra vulgaris TaxID=6087 RepID=A0ABM4DK82_HYDVU